MENQKQHHIYKTTESPSWMDLGLLFSTGRINNLCYNLYRVLLMTGGSRKISQALIPESSGMSPLFTQRARVLLEQLIVPTGNLLSNNLSP